MAKLREVIEELIESFGLRTSIGSGEYECIKHHFLLGEYGHCIKRLKKFLDLEMVEVRIRYVTDEEMMASLTREERDEFEAAIKMGRLGNSSRIISQIGMRISIPKNIPQYGSREFRGFSTILQINKGLFNSSFDHFLADAAHEMMHILLYATRHRLQHSEKAVDLMLMLQGFMEVNERIYAKGNYNSYLSAEEVRGICSYLRKRR